MPCHHYIDVYLFTVLSSSDSLPPFLSSMHYSIVTVSLGLMVSMVAAFRAEISELRNIRMSISMSNIITMKEEHKRIRRYAVNNASKFQR